jgi:regulator of protease activity HflC (stomatin/prohibitin superfamily)
MNALGRFIDGTPIGASKQPIWHRFIDRQLPFLVVFLLVVTLVGILLFPHVAVTVPSGQVGILWKRFAGGTELGPKSIRDEGLRVVWPWNKLFLYDLRLQSITEDYNVISSDGVKMTASINIRFRLQHDGVAVLHQTLGPNYVEVLIRPAIGSLTREVVSQYTAEQVYSTGRQEIQHKIHELTLEKAGQSTMSREGEDSYNVTFRNLFILYDTLLYGIRLPEPVVAAINRKVEQYYIVQEYGFRVEREKKESERKRIEAQGIRQFQQTVTEGVTDSYLRWRGIDATVQLSQSPNSKIVIVGNGKDGLPLIFGSGSGSQPAAGDTGPTEESKPPSGQSQAEGTDALAASAAAPHPAWPTLSPSDISAMLSRTAEATWATPQRDPEPPR